MTAYSSFCTARWSWTVSRAATPRSSGAFGKPWARSSRSRSRMTSMPMRIPPSSSALSAGVGKPSTFRVGGKTDRRDGEPGLIRGVVKSVLGSAFIPTTESWKLNPCPDCAGWDHRELPEVTRRETSHVLGAVFVLSSGIPVFGGQLLDNQCTLLVVKRYANRTS